MLTTGTRLNQYEVLSHIGSGGMGEVYRALDTRLKREVALKVLPDQFSRDPERVARFKREAQLLAQLNHHNIAAIYGVEQSDGKNFLVLELVLGETLRERVRKGAVPLDEALGICKQIAEALEHAHEKTIIHRDLKPANVKVTPEGQVKVLDFGLAKAFVGDEPGTAPLDTPTLSGSPSIPGIIIGTPAYMSPEQARGKGVDKRTDIWAFGCVLFELLTGKQSFSGESTPDILGAVMHKEVDWNALPASTAPVVRTLLRRCMQKEARERLRDAADIRIEIAEIQAASSPAATAISNAPAPAPRRSMMVTGLACLVTAVLGALAVWLMRPAQSPEPKPVSRFAIALPTGDRLQTAANGTVLDLSKDGSRVVYAAIHSGVPQLYVRALDGMGARPIAGTDEALSPFFSPDGQSVGFLVIPQLKTIAVSGGTPQNVSIVINDTGGASWGPNDTIVFSRSAGEAVRTVPASGGTPSLLTTLKGENSHRWPQLLPDGRAVLFTNWIDTGDTSQILAERTDTHERKVLVQGGTFPRYVPTGHLLFARGATLMAVPFDLNRLEVRGQPVAVVEGLMQTGAGAGQFSVSNSGSLAYVPGGLQGVERTLVWVDRKGAEQPLSAPLRAYQQPRLAPDGQHLALNIDSNIWIYDMARGTLTRLTFEAGNSRPLWTPDGKRVAYQSTKSGKANLWWKAADGTGRDEQLTNSDFFFLPSSISPDLVAAYVETRPETNRDIYVVPLNGDRKPKPWLQTPFDETYPLFSPDGKWLAYVSNESGRFEIYVRPASGTGGKWQISTDGGQADQWNPNGKELFYQNGDKMYAVEIKAEPTFSAGTPRLLFEGTYEKQPGVGANYNVSPDGQRFLMIKPGGVRQEGATQINVVLNWFEELKKKVPVK